jgi:hypothetical protein
VCSAGHDPGFGQSLLHEGKLVFEVGQMGLRMSPNKASSPTQFSFTRGYMSDLASPETDTGAPLVSGGEGGITSGSSSTTVLPAVRGNVKVFFCQTFSCVRV